MTVLFLEDWEKEGALPNWNTKNQSFIDVAMLYKEMGVKNYAFILALRDQSLKDIDPFDRNISPENALKVAIECKTNFWYFVREIARDPSGSAEFPLTFVASRGIIAAYWLFMNHILVILIMIRQTGKSFGIDWLNEWLLNIALTKGEISYLTKDEKLRGRLLERIKAMELTLPEYLKQRSSKDAGNTEVLRIGSLGNTFKAYVPNRSPKLADLIGRGMTAGITIVDEWAYCSNNWITIPVMLSATLAAIEVAMMKGEPYGTIFMTTSGKRDMPEGRYAYNFMQNAAVWSENFFDAKNITELKSMVLKAGNGKDLRVNCTFNHRQLGKTDEWLRDRLRSAAQVDDVSIKADFLNEWPSGTLSSPFSPEIAQMMRDGEVLEFFSRIEEPEPYLTRWYCAENNIESILASTHHILSIDPSDAIGSDGIGISLRNVLDGSILMAADISESNLIPFCRWIAGFMKKYSKVVLIIERRSTGAMILDFLLEYLPSVGIDPFKRIYNQAVQYKEEFPDRFREIQHAMNSRDNLYLKYKKYFGWATSGTGATSRTELFSRTLTNAAKMTGSIMKDRKLILQTLGLEVRNGRIDHAEGEHDDLCFIGSTLIRTIDGNRPISELRVGDLVLTRKGYKPVIYIHRNEREVVDKFKWTGTPDHPFITPDGIIKLSDLNERSVVYSWDEKQSCIKESSIIDILTPQELICGNTITGMINGKNHPLHFIAKCTKMLMDQFRKGWISTIETITTQITQSIILSASLEGNTESIIQCPKKLENELQFEVKETHTSKTGLEKIRRPLRNYTVAKESRFYQLWQNGRKKIPNLLLKFTKKQVEKAERRQELVYNLHITECHEYFANDVLVHNCVSWLLSFWLMSQGKNLDYYGIDASKILTENHVYKKNLKEVSAYERDVSAFARSEVERITNILKDENDEYVAKRLEYDLELAISRLSEQDKKIVAVDDLINRLREERFRNIKKGYNYGDGQENQGEQGYVSYNTNSFENPYWN